MGNFIKTMSIRLTVLALAAIAVANAEMMMMYTNTPTSDPAGNHCQDFTADMSTADAQQWWSANSYAYPASQGWTNGSVCDPKTYPVVEQHEHPIGVNDVTLRRCGKNGTECLTYQWWTDNAWHYDGWTKGTECPAPYTKLTRDEHPIAVPCIDLFSYGVGAEVEPLAEVSQEWTSVMILHTVQSGGSHCTELYWQEGKDNQYWKDHGYQYPTNLWPQGTCDRSVYNWWNRNSTVAEGVTMEQWGKHI